MRRKIRIMTSLVLSIALLAGCSNSPVGVTKTEPEALSGGDSVQTEQKESPDINENDGETAGNSVHHNIEESIKKISIFTMLMEAKYRIYPWILFWIFCRTCMTGCPMNWNMTKIMRYLQEQERN